MSSFKLVSSDLCPFVQRAVIALNHKRVACETIEVDLHARPEWFNALSPTGQVPMLLVEHEGEGDSAPEVVFDSAVINEYLDELTPGTLLPEDPQTRARHRSAIALSSRALDEAWRLGRAAGEFEAHGHAGVLRGQLERLEAMVEGPLFAGEALCLVDAAVLPLLQRVAWTAELVPELGLLDGLPKLHAWLETGLALPAVADSLDEGAAARYQQLFIEAGSWVGREGAGRRRLEAPPLLQTTPASPLRAH